MEKRCKSPTNELRKQYVCDICGRIYHNVVCGTFSDGSSLCSGCSAKKYEKTAKTVDNVQLVVTPTQRLIAKKIQIRLVRRKKY